MRESFRFFVFFICCLFCSTTFANTKYIIDTDMGFDDWLAVLYLLKQPVVVSAITIDCQGETFCPQGAENAEKLTRLAKHDVPIAMGNSRLQSRYDFPLPIRQFASRMAVSGFSNLKKYRHILSASAAKLIFDNVINAAIHHDKIVIISIGTATNIADALKLAQKKHETALFQQGLKMIYKGGGAFGALKNRQLTNNYIPGNISIPTLLKSNNKTAEWNIYANAPAMQALITAQLPVTFVPNNATDRVTMSKQSYDLLYAHSSTNSLRRFSANAMQETVSGNWNTAAKNLDFWDTVTTMIALHPELVAQQFKQVPIRIILTPGNHYGTTWVTADSNDKVTVDYRIHKKLFYRKLIAF